MKSKLTLIRVCLIGLVGFLLLTFSHDVLLLIKGIDNSTLLFLRSSTDRSLPRGPGWIQESMVEVSALGGGTILFLVVMASAGFLFIKGQYHAVLLLLAASWGGNLINTLLKMVFARARPSLVPPLTAADYYSFPSGHAFLSATVYLTLGSLMSQLVQGKKYKVYLLFVSGIVTILIGVSRVYLGVHYPTDVVAGWILGTLWASLCAWCTRKLQRQGIVEGEA